MKYRKKPVVDFTPVGAVGDGVTDDTAAIQSYLNYNHNRNKTEKGAQ